MSKLERAAEPRRNVQARGGGEAAEKCPSSRKRQSRGEMSKLERISEDTGMRWRRPGPFLLVEGVFVWCVLVGIEARCQQPQAGQSVSSQGFHLIAKYTIGGEGGWDYLSADSIARRLYIARSNRVTVLDLDKGTVAGEIPNTNGVHGVAVANDLGRGFVSCGLDGKVEIFDLKTLKPILEVKAGGKHDANIDDVSTRRRVAS